MLLKKKIIYIDNSCMTMYIFVFTFFFNLKKIYWFRFSAQLAKGHSSIYYYEKMPSFPCLTPNMTANGHNGLWLTETKIILLRLKDV
jgi:hypothetical protein